MLTLCLCNILGAHVRQGVPVVSGYIHQRATEEFASRVGGQATFLGNVFICMVPVLLPAMYQSFTDLSFLIGDNTV
jgi:hypothetical protein